MGARRPLELLRAAVPPTTVVVAAAVVVALSGIPAAVADGIRTSLGVALLVAASVGAVVALRRGLRHGRLVDVAWTGTAASLAGGALTWLSGDVSPAPALLGASAFGLVAAVGARDETLVVRPGWRSGAAVAVVAAAELAVVVGLLPGLADAVEGAEQILLVVAVAGAAVGMLTAMGRPWVGALGLLGLAPLALALGDGAGGEVLALGAVTAGQLLAAGTATPAASRVQGPGTELSAALDHVTDAVLHFDGRLRLTTWNAVAAALLGLDAGSAGARLEDLLGVPVGDLPSSAGAGSRLEGIGGLAIALHRDGDGVLAVVTHPPVVDDSADRLGRELRATIEELLQARRTIDLQRTELERASTVDPLTGVASRAAILQRLEMEVAEARRYRHPVAIVLLDVDGFGELNHRVGIDDADAILREVALRIRLRVRQADALGRSGSDGFLAILPHTDESGAATFADALRQRASQRPVSVGDELLRVTLSAGVAVMRAGEELDVDGLLRRADEALESARRAGGDRIALDRLHGLARLDGGAPRGASVPEETAQDSGA